MFKSGARFFREIIVPRWQRPTFLFVQLDCAPLPGESNRCVYVGIAAQHEVGVRIRDEASQKKHTAADYCAQHKPTRVLLEWPAATRAVEAYVFNVVLGSLGAQMDVRAVAGFTQTSVKPSPLVVQQCRQAWRCMNSMCFRCGSKRYFAKACDKAEEGLPYACKQCGGELALTSRGATNYAISGGGGSAASSSGVGGGSSRRPGGASGVVVTPSAGSKRAVPTASSPPPRRSRNKLLPRNARWRACAANCTRACRGTSSRATQAPHTASGRGRCARRMRWSWMVATPASSKNLLGLATGRRGLFAGSGEVVSGRCVSD